jgi:phage gp45-like
MGSSVTRINASSNKNGIIYNGMLLEVNPSKERFDGFGYRSHAGDLNALSIGYPF